jgi:hypothetical protein
MRADQDTKTRVLSIKVVDAVAVEIVASEWAGVRAARRGRVDPVVFENVGNRAASNLMSQIGHRALDARVSLIHKSR